MFVVDILFFSDKEYRYSSIRSGNLSLRNLIPYHTIYRRKYIDSNRRNSQLNDIIRLDKIVLGKSDIPKTELQ